MSWPELKSPQYNAQNRQNTNSAPWNGVHSAQYNAQNQSNNAASWDGKHSDQYTRQGPNDIPSWRRFDGYDRYNGGSWFGGGGAYYYGQPQLALGNPFTGRPWTIGGHIIPINGGGYYGHPVYANYSGSALRADRVLGRTGGDRYNGVVDNRPYAREMSQFASQFENARPSSTGRLYGNMCNAVLNLGYQDRNGEMKADARYKKAAELMQAVNEADHSESAHGRARFYTPQGTKALTEALASTRFDPEEMKNFDRVWKSCKDRDEAYSTNVMKAFTEQHGGCPAFISARDNDRGDSRRNDSNGERSYDGRGREETRGGFHREGRDYDSHDRGDDRDAPRFAKIENDEQLLKGAKTVLFDGDDRNDKSYLKAAEEYLKLKGVEVPEFSRALNASMLRGPNGISDHQALELIDAIEKANRETNPDQKLIALSSALQDVSKHLDDQFQKASTPAELQRADDYRAAAQGNGRN